MSILPGVYLAGRRPGRLIPFPEGYNPPVALRRGKRVAVAAVAGALLLVAGAGLAYRRQLVHAWEMRQAEKATWVSLTRPIPKTLRVPSWKASRSPPPKMSDFPEILRQFSIWIGIDLALSPEAAQKLSDAKQVFFAPPEFNLDYASIGAYLRSFLASADSGLDYTVRGGTVVIVLKGQN